ncbi:MAG: DNA polymerase IV [Chitinophagales bacterium]|nr:DNA polymerase IV [Chitinophagales bacterium]
MEQELRAKDRFSQNSLTVNARSVMMYLDMNSFFASCEQQDNPALRNRPIGVITHPSANACVIAPSVEAKKFGVKTGMRLGECRELCPQIIPVLCRPQRYRDFHVRIMKVLCSYCDDVLPKSIDEAVMNFTSYRKVYSDFTALARQIKADIYRTCGEYVKCSIGIAPNAFLAKLATELQKPDGLVEITPDNIDEHLSKLKLTDLPGIAKANERRLLTIGIRSPLQMRHSSEPLLRKAFGGVVGNYWYKRLHFMEVDMYKNNYRGMSAGRTLSRQQREDPQALESMLISLCTRLEQRMVKQEVFCGEVCFAIKYHDGTRWDTKIKLANPTQDAMDMRKYILQKIHAFEDERKGAKLFSNKTQHMLVSISAFVTQKLMQYSLFENTIRKDEARRAMYRIKDDYGKNSVRRAAEIIQHDVMRDAIGFGSVKDLYDGNNFNHYLLEEDTIGAKEKRTPRKELISDDTPDWEMNQDPDEREAYLVRKQEQENNPDKRVVKKPEYKKVTYYDAWGG